MNHAVLINASLASSQTQVELAGLINKDMSGQGQRSVEDQVKCFVNILFFYLTMLFSLALEIG